MWLYTIARRLGEDELTSFIQEHDLLGYLKEDGGELAVYRGMAKDLFYISLAPSDGQADRQLWGGFGEFGTGIRLRLRFQDVGEVRGLFYGNRETVLKQINRDLASEGFGALVPWGLSRMIAYYLPDDYSDEKEFRLLRKRFNPGMGTWRSDGAYEYCPLDLGPDGSGAPAELLAIDVGKHADLDIARKVLSGTAFSNVPVKQAP